MTSPASASRAASSAAGRTISSPASPRAKIYSEETEDVALDRPSPGFNERWEDLMNWEHTERSGVIPSTSGLLTSAIRRCPSAPASTLNIETYPTVKVDQRSGIPEVSRKRKASPATDGHIEAAKISSRNELPVSRRSHNAIEKRYRANLNQKITALKDAVPSLRKLSATPVEELDGPSSAQKLNKATVLSKAIEYIQHLESRNQRLEEENAILREGVAGTERVENPTSEATEEVAPEIDHKAASLDLASGSTVAQESSPAFNDPQGMIRVPEEIRRLRQGVPQVHYHERSTRPLPSSGGIEVYLGAMLRMP